MTKFGDFQGTWRCISCESVEDLIKKYSSIKPNQIYTKCPLRMLLKIEFTKKENKWRIISETNFETILTRFEIGKEFNDETVYGKKVKSIATIDESKLVVTQNTNGNSACVISHQISKNGELIVAFKTKDIEANRVFQRTK